MCSRGFIFNLIEKCPPGFVNERNNDGMTALLVAINSNHKSAIRVLLEEKANWSLPCSKGNNALDVCAKNNNCDVIEIIRHNVDKNEWKGNMDRRNGDNCTALHIASFMGHVEVASLLLRYGASPNDPTLRNRWQQTPLEAAADQNHLDLVQVYLDHLCKDKVGLDKIKEETKIA